VPETTFLTPSNCGSWAKRLSQQRPPIFYPVLTVEYARQIARDWNTQDAVSGFAGFVTRFELAGEFARRYPGQTAGGRAHQELWVPAEELEEFVGTIDPKTNIPVDLLE
jgi:hypothetical protein